MKRISLYIVLILFVAVFVFPSAVQAQSVEAEYRATLLRLIESLQQQIALLQAELERRAAAEVEYRFLMDQDSFSSEVVIQAVYPIKTAAQVAAIPDQTHRQHAARVRTLFPVSYRNVLAELMVFGAKRTTLDSFVETIPPQYNTWRYGVSEFMLEDADTESSTELIVHELGHLVSYRASVGVPVAGNSSCHRYFSLRECPPHGSYLEQFVAKFWDEQDLDRAISYASGDYDAAYRYYERHNSSYVSDYAATGPEEDFSESFMYFVLGKTPASGLAAEKVAFFVQYADLVSLRAEVLAAR